MTYQELKTYVSENKQKAVLAICFVLVFIVGFGTGRYERTIRRNAYKPQNNYTTQQTKTPSPPVAAETIAPEQGTVAGTATTTQAACLIKGNISSGGKKIYHVKGGAFYDRTNAELCFKTEAEAQAMGFVKSSR